MPGVANRSRIEAFGLEQPHGRRQVFLAFPNPAEPDEGCQKGPMDMLVERRELEPLVQISERFIVGNAPGEMLEQGGVTRAESPSLCGEPSVEDRAAVDFQAVEEVAVEQRR